MGGGQVRRTVQKARWTKVASRTTRARRMGRRAAAAVAVGCDVPSVAYGASAAGISDGMLTALRRNVAMSFGPLQGRSTSVRLLMESCDPGLTIVVGAVCDWVKAWWDHMLDRKVMEDALRHAQKTVGISARPNAAVVGGAGSYIAALRRLGWGAPRADTICTREGQLLFFGDSAVPHGAAPADPRTIWRWAVDAYEYMILAGSLVAQEINDLSGTAGYGRAKNVAASARATVDTDGEGGATTTAEVAQGQQEAAAAAAAAGMAAAAAQKHQTGASAASSAAAAVGETGPKYFGENEFEAAAAGVWRRAHFECAGGLAVPWIWPIARAARAARRRGHRQAAASLRACAEGGWWTQSRLYAKGVASSAR